MSQSLKRSLVILFISSFLSIFWLTVPSNVMAFKVGEVVTYNVTHRTFNVVWEAQFEGGESFSDITSYTINLFETDGSTVLDTYNFTPYSPTAQSTTGLMVGMIEFPSDVINQGDHDDDAHELHEYDFQIEVVINSSTYHHPLIRLKTQDYDEGNGNNPNDSEPSLKFVVQKEDETTQANGAFVCFKVKPPHESSSWYGTWVTNMQAIISTARVYSKSTNQYMVVDNGYALDVKALGGTWGSAAGSISSYNKSTVCQTGFECYYNYNKIIVAPNQGPVITPDTPGGDIQIYNDDYVIKPDESFILDVQASDPDGDNVVGSTWDLQISPTPTNPMTIAEDGADPSVAHITWNPATADLSGANSRTYTVTVSVEDDLGKSGTKNLPVVLTNGKPSDPTVSIAPTSPKTGETIICTASGSVDPLGISFDYYYTWYKDAGSGFSIVIEGVDEDEVVATVKGDEWYCAVKAVNSDSDESGSVNSNTVTVVNTPPTANITVTINQTDPNTNTDLTASIEMTGCDDADGDACTYQVKWYESADPGTSYSNTDSLDHSNTSKNQTWTCEATVWDTEQGMTTGTNSDSVQIINLPPSDPAGIGIERVAGGIRCYINTASTDPDGDTPTYLYNWTCTVTGGPFTGQTQSINAEDTLPDTGNGIVNVAKNQTWTCSVQASDPDGGLSNTVPCTGDIYIDNTSPKWDVYPTVSSTGTAYNDSILTCTVEQDAATDADAGDQITYSYEWYKGDSTAIPGATAFTLDPGAVDLLEQGESYYCKVTACDDSSPPACIYHNTNSLLIENRDPTITVWRGNEVIADGQTVQVTETEELVLTIVSDDADNNTLDFLDPDTAEPLTSNAVFDKTVGPNEAEFTWTPAQGDAGTYEVVFKVEETDSPDFTEITQVKIEVIYPSKVIDNFEFQSEPDPDWYLPTNDEQDLEKRSDHGWSVLTGSGHIYRKPYENDPNNHYMNMDSSESNPLKYIATLWLADPNETKEFYGLRCFIDSNNGPYSVEAYVHVVDTVSGGDKDYFLRYIPEDPSQHSGNEFEVDGMYINYYIGSEFIDPNGCTLERNMEDDIHNAIAAKGKQYQSHYDYVWGFILRGDIDKFDDLEVVYGERDTVSPNPVAAENVSAVGIDKAVVLTWTDPNQEDDLLGYKIEWEKDGVKVDEEVVYVFDEGISGEVKSCTITFTSNLGAGEYYSFTIKAFDEEKAPNYSEASGAKSARPHKDETPPVMSSCVLNTEVPETMGETIDLTWNDPNDPEVSYFVLYMDGTEIATVDSAVYSYRKTGLVNGTDYTFEIKGFNADGYGAPGSNEPIGTPRAPQVLVFDIFDYAVDGDEPEDHGWSRLQGSGNMDAVYEDGNSYMKVTTDYTNKLNFIVTKFVDNPGDYTNPELHFDLKGVAGEFRIDLYVSDDAGNKYFLSYCGAAVDSTPANPKDGMYITHNIGCDGTWRHVQRNLNDDIQDGVSGAAFGNFLGMVIRGEVCIDDVIFKEAVSEVTKLTARPGNGEVELSWTCPDPNIVDEFTLSVDGGSSDPIGTLITGTTDEYSHTVTTGLNNGTEYTFRVMQVINEVESDGVEVTATPRDAYQDDCDDQSLWDDGGDLGAVYTEYDSDIHSEVMVIDPNANAVNSYFVDHEIDPGALGGVVTLRIKAESEFSLWFKFSDNNNAERNLVYFSGGNANTGDNIGDWDYWFYRYLGPSYTDGRWHTLTLDLNSDLENLKNLNFTVTGISSVSIGGEVRVDDVSVY